jgi:hypothetical protein
MKYGQIVRDDSFEEGKEELVDLVGTETPRNADSENSEKDRINPLRKRKCLGVMCLVVVGFILCLGSLFLLNNQDLDSDNELSAKIIGCYSCYKHDLNEDGGIIHRPKRCEDTEFGCCEVFGDCSVSGDSYETKAYHLGRKFKLDKEGSNCPTLEEMVKLYKKNNDMDECHDPSNSYTEHGCCSVLTTCDKIIKNNETLNQTYSEDRLLREDINLYIQKNDINGSNCPTIQEIVTYYDTYYNVNHLLFGIGFILLVFGLLSL